MFAQAARFSVTSCCAIRRAVSMSGNVLQREQRLRRPCRQAGCRAVGPANPAAADHDVSIVKNRGLSGRDRFLRLVQLDASAPVLQRREGRAGPGMAVTNLDRDFDRLIRLVAAAPVHLVDFEIIRDQIFRGADDDAICLPDRDRRRSAAEANRRANPCAGRW